MGHCVQPNTRKPGNIHVRRYVRGESRGKISRGLQGGDLNPRPPGYEPDELPGCSTLRQVFNYGPSV